MAPALQAVGRAFSRLRWLLERCQSASVGLSYRRFGPLEVVEQQGLRLVRGPGLQQFEPTVPAVSSIPGLRVCREVSVVDRRYWVLDRERLYSYGGPAILAEKLKLAFSITTWCWTRVDKAFGPFLHPRAYYYHDVAELFFQFFLLRRRAPDVPILWIGEIQAHQVDLVRVFEEAGAQFLLVPATGVCVRVGEYYSLDAPGKRLRHLAAAFGAEFGSYVDFLRERLCPGLREGGTARVYAVRRGVARAFANEERVSAIFRSFGYDLVDFGAMPLSEQVRACAGARALAGAHGSNLTNALFMAPGSLLLEIVPLDPPTPGVNPEGWSGVTLYEDLARVRGLRYLRLDMTERERVDEAALEEKLREAERTT